MPGQASSREVLQLVPGLGADDAGEDDQRDDVQGVGVDAVADEVPVQDDRGADRRQPEQQTEGANVRKTEIDIGIHAGFSIVGRPASPLMT